jgi:hypothetical protein
MREEGGWRRSCWGLLWGLVVVCGWGGAASAGTKEEASRPQYEVAIELDYGEARFKGRQELRWRNGGEAGVESLDFHLYPNVGSEGEREDRYPLRVRRVVVDGQEARYSYRMGGGGLRVDLGERISPGQWVSLVFELEGRLPRVQREESSLLAHFLEEVQDALEEDPGKRPGVNARDIYFAGEEALLVGHFFPLLALRPFQSNEVKFPVGIHRVVWTEVADYEVSVTVNRSGLLVIGSGEEVGSEEVAEGKRHRFRGRACRGFAIVLAERMRSLESMIGGRPLRTHYREGDRRVGERVQAIASRALEVYEEAFGGLPYDPVQVIELPLTSGYNFVSFPGLIILPQAYYVDFDAPDAVRLPGVLREQSDVIRSSFEFLLAQAMAFQWWGEAVGSDPERAPFLDAGLATFGSILYHEVAYGKPIGELVLRQHVRGTYQAFRMLGGVDQEADRPLREYRSRLEYAAIVESKGALFWVQLRSLLGDEVFFAYLRSYGESYRFRQVTVEQWRQRLLAAGSDPKTIRQLQQRWFREKRGDEEMGGPDLTLVPGPVSRIRSLGRLFLRIGKTAARPF